MKLFAASTALFIGLMGVYTVPLQIGVFVETLGLDEAHAGYLGSIELAALSIVTMLLGLVVSRVSLLKLAIAGIVISVTAQLTSMYVQDYFPLTLLRFGVGMGCGFILAAATATIASSEDPDRLYGHAFACASLAYGVWLTLLPYGAAAISAKGIFVMLSVISVLSLPILRYLPAGGSDSQASQAGVNINWGSVALLILAITLVYNAYGGTYYFSERIGANIGIATETIALAYGLSAITGCIGASLASWCSTRFKRTVPLVTAFSLIGLISLGVVFSSNQAQFMTVIILMNGVFMFAISYVLSTAAVLDRLGRIAALAEGYVIFAMSMGTAIFGAVAAKTDYTVLAWPAFLACCLGALVIIPLARKMEQMQRIA